jgi:hypothetical protein
LHERHGGLALIVDVWSRRGISSAGLAFSLAAATYMLYLLLGEHAVVDRGAVALALLGVRARDAVLLAARTLVELPLLTASAPTFCCSGISPPGTCRSGCS